MSYYPVFLQLAGRRCVVIGGDSLMEEKVRGLLDGGADVTVVDPEPTPGLLELGGRGEIEHVARDYRHGDLQGAFLAFSARHDRHVVDAIVEEAARRNLPLNVIDQPDDCSFIAPSVVRRGDLVIATSTSGKAPALAVRLRQRLEAETGEHHAEFLRLAGRLRGPLAERYPDFEERKALWYRLVDSEVLTLLGAGRRADAVAAIESIVGFSVEAPS